MAGARTVPDFFTTPLFALILASTGLPPAFWLYLAGAVALVLGLLTILRDELPLVQGSLKKPLGQSTRAEPMLLNQQAGGQRLGQSQVFSQTWHGAEKALPFGRLFFAIPLAVFGAEHFISAKAIANIIPAWIPGHLFWTYLVGVALLAAAFSIVLNRLAGLAALLLGIMLFCFVLLIHLPRLAGNPGDRFSIAVVLRDLAFSAGAFALATTKAKETWRPAARKAVPVARYVVAVALLFFGVEHFLHPGFVPVVPLELAMPAWMPFHWLWSYGVGAALLCAGLLLAANKQARLAAMWLGILVFAVVLLVYLPILAANPTDIGVAMNYFADTLLVSGGLMVLASAMPTPRGT